MSAAGFRLKPLGGSRKGQVIDLVDTVVLLGRDPSCQIKVDPERDAMVSGRHSEILLQGSGYVLRDLSSRNGTYLNGDRVTTTPLDNGDIVRLGREGPEFLFMARSPEGLPTTITLIVRNGGLAGTRSRFQQESVTLGRGPDNDLILHPEKDSAVSTRHARIFHRGGVYYLEDAGSRNGTFLGGRRLPAAEPIHSGDVFSLGRSGVELSVLYAEPARAAPAQSPGPAAAHPGAASRSDADIGTPIGRLAPLVARRIGELQGFSKALFIVSVCMFWLMLLIGLIVGSAGAVVTLCGVLFVVLVVLLA